MVEHSTVIVGQNANTKQFYKNQSQIGINIIYVMKADKALFTLNYYNAMN